MAPRGHKVVITVAGTYSAFNHKAVQKAEGDTLYCHSWYAQELVESGHADFVNDAQHLTRLVDSNVIADDLSDLPLVGKDIVGALWDRNIRSIADVNTATDDELLAVAGIGPSTVTAIRNYLREGN